MPASSAYMDYFVVEPQFGVLIGLWPSFHVNLNLNHYNIQYRLLPVLILLLLWLWPIGVKPFSGRWGPNQIGPGGDYLQAAFVCSECLNSLAGTVLVQS